MIATRIRGGLGNQLFQYATARAVALRLGTDLALDLRDWQRTQPYEFSLGHFNIQTVPAKGLPIGRGDRFGEIVKKMISGQRMRVYREGSLGYDTGINTVSDGTLLKGYWQTERYFSDFEDDIRRDLSFSTAPGSQTLNLLTELETAPAISLHVRRGDYVSNAKYNAAHGTTGLGYYTNAAKFIAEQTGLDPIIYAFSDDPDWVRENLTVPFEMKFVSHNDGSTAYDDLRLMAACKHHIIANSSFSWWGAWLNPSKTKQVVAPKIWFVKEGQDNPDITPFHWHRL